MLWHESSYIGRTVCFINGTLHVGGGTIPPNCKKIREKNGKRNQYDFYKYYQNPLGQLLKQFSKLYKLWGPVT